VSVTRTTATVLRLDGPGASRRRLYRRTKRLLLGLLARRWTGPRITLEPAVRRFLRARPRSFLSRVAADRGFALAAAGSLLAGSTAGALPPINLAHVVTGCGGFVINGIDAFDYSGFSVSGAGDVNGDGLADVITGARLGSPGDKNAYAGESYVVFGKAETTPVELADIAATGAGFVINGIDLSDYSGRSVSGAGDVNGDGLADVIVGANNADPNGNTAAGESYVVFGKADTTAVELSDVVAAIGGFVINGIDPDDQSGYSVSGAGDVNGDGLADVIVGAWGADPAGHNKAGESYVVFGKADTTAVQLSDVAAGRGGFVIIGIDTYDYSGFSVSGAGDVNGDGLADVIVGARFANPGGRHYAGESYVVFGKADTTAVELSAIAAGKGGFVINGIDPLDFSGRSVSDAGDVNGDGLADVVIGARGADPAGNLFAGESYVVFGKADGTPVSLAAVAAGNGGGFVMYGIDMYDFSGWSVSGAGDINGDGLADVIVGAKGADRDDTTFSGESYLVLGKADSTPVELSDVVAGTGGFVMYGIDSGDGSGYSVSDAGDVNGDGMADVVVGALGANPGDARQAGESYVVFSPVVRGDLDGDGVVGFLDFLMLLGAWGPCAGSCPPFCAGDLDGDCTVGITDFLLLLAAWS